METDTKANQAIQQKLAELRALLNVKQASLCELKLDTENHNSETIQNVANKVSTQVINKRYDRLKAAALANTFDANE